MLDRGVKPLALRHSAVRTDMIDAMETRRRRTSAVRGSAGASHRDGSDRARWLDRAQNMRDRLAAWRPPARIGGLRRQRVLRRPAGARDHRCVVAASRARDLRRERRQPDRQPRHPDRRREPPRPPRLRVPGRLLRPRAEGPAHAARPTGDAAVLARVLRRRRARDVQGAPLEHTLAGGRRSDGRVRNASVASGSVRSPTRTSGTRPRASRRSRPSSGRTVRRSNRSCRSPSASAARRRARAARRRSRPAPRSCR